MAFDACSCAVNTYSPTLRPCFAVFDIFRTTSPAGVPRDLQDNITSNWGPEKVAEVLVDYVPRLDVSTVSRFGQSPPAFST